MFIKRRWNEWAQEVLGPFKKVLHFMAFTGKQKGNTKFSDITKFVPDKILCLQNEMNEVKI